MKEDFQRMEERLLSSRDAWEKAQYEIRQHQAKLAEVDVTIKKHELSQYASSTEFKAFKVPKPVICIHMKVNAK